MAEDTVHVRMDDQGRIVIPADIRRRLGTDEFTLHATPGEIILRRSDPNGKELEDWYERIQDTAPTPKPSGEETKWASDHYGRRKLGL